MVARRLDRCRVTYRAPTALDAYAGGCPRTANTSGSSIRSNSPPPSGHHARPPTAATSFFWKAETLHLLTPGSSTSSASLHYRHTVHRDPRSATAATSPPLPHRAAADPVHSTSCGGGVSCGLRAQSRLGGEVAADPQFAPTSVAPFAARRGGRKSFGRAKSTGVGEKLRQHLDLIDRSGCGLHTEPVLP